MSHMSKQAFVGFLKVVVDVGIFPNTAPRMQRVKTAAVFSASNDEFCATNALLGEILVIQRPASCCIAKVRARLNSRALKRIKHELHLLSYPHSLLQLWANRPGSVD